MPSTTSLRPFHTSLHLCPMTPKTVIIQLTRLWQELKFAVSTFQSSLPRLIKYLLCAFIVPSKLLTRHLQYHPYFLPTPLIHLHMFEYYVIIYVRNVTKPKVPNVKDCIMKCTITSTQMKRYSNFAIINYEPQSLLLFTSRQYFTV